jgi:hypothetical protein
MNNRVEWFCGYFLLVVGVMVGMIDDGMARSV